MFDGFTSLWKILSVDMIDIRLTCITDAQYDTSITKLLFLIIFLAKSSIDGNYDDTSITWY